MAAPTCRIVSCDGRVYRRELCGAHYGRWSRYGDPLEGGPMREPKASTEAIDDFLSSAFLCCSDGCLNWPFSKFTTTGYGQLMLGPSRGGGEFRPVGAHVFVCRTVHGDPTSDGMEVAHSCGNRSCVNPKHLRWATRAENHADRLIHGTMLLGEKNGAAKLTEAEVVSIRNSARLPQRQLAKNFGVGKTTIARVLKRETWAAI